MTDRYRRTYIWYTGTPVFPFGYGLHYTNFSAHLLDTIVSTYDISTLVTSNTSVTCLDQIPLASIPIVITNTGRITSDYVVLGFLSGEFGPAPYPNKALKAYSRLHNITGGESQTATLPLTLGSLARADVNGDIWLFPGNYTFSVDTTDMVTWRFELKGEAVKLEHWPVSPA
jgi:beta-D-xylosidase 4